MGSEFVDRKGRPLVAVTGMGIVTSLGRGKEENWSKLVAGQSGIRHITRFPTEGLRTTIAGTVESCTQQPYSAYDLSCEILEDVIAEALNQAGLLDQQFFGGPLFVATPPSEFEWPLFSQLYRHGVPLTSGSAYARMLAAARTGSFARFARAVEFASIADRMQERFGTRGEPVSICTACASGATAVQMGVEAIRRGETERALCAAVDATVHPEGLVRFSLLSALSAKTEIPASASKPFSRNRDGFVIAEGGAAVVLESYSAARARGAEIIGLVLGCGEKADDYHRTRSKPDGTAIIGAIRSAIADADVESVDYVNAHGTSTPENDKMEYLSLLAVFGERLDKIPVSSNKSMLGHTLIAAGLVEAVVSLMTLGEGILPPTINYKDPDPELPLDVVPNVARRQKVDVILSNSFGFGGQNACLVFSSMEGVAS
ncbi:MAG: beta-ketoacyl-ACP synthase [Hyphomicrobiaceae bacterium]|nr:beta-ketoacyl-ACP synthase [Hyphomicrobiaceae bacterium]